ncbi:PREDICTED: plectin-like [Chaetura pelagica]|uniref:plectin-like n=1 Tax=Chaetura pelagica TaxID=8897 RepID=UPI0005231C0E|nr:PREDICTED: plectin-like [Chaetura pelagica]
MAEEERDKPLTPPDKEEVQPQNAQQYERVHLWTSQECDSDCCRESEEQKQYPVEKNKFHLEDPCRTEGGGKPSVEPKSRDSELGSEHEALPEEYEEDLQEMGDDNLKVANKMMKQAIEKEREAFHALRAGELHRTVELFTDAIRFSPQLAVLYVSRATVYLRLLKPIAAIRDCDQAIKIDPDSPQPYHWRGKAFQLLGHWHKAARDLELACQLGYNEDTDCMLTEVQRRIQGRKQRDYDVVGIAERVKEESKEALLRTNKAPKDMERIKKAALEEKYNSQDMDQSWEEAMKKDHIQAEQKRNTPQDVTEQQESLEQKVLQKAVPSPELEQQLFALQMKLLEQFKIQQMGLEEKKKNTWKVLEQQENAQRLLEEERNQFKTLQELEKAQQLALVGLIKTAKEEYESAQKKPLEEKERAEKALEELARAQKKALEELEMAQKNALEELEKAHRKALQEQERVWRSALEEQKRAQKALEELKLLRRKVVEEQERAQIRAVREQERAQQILKELAKTQQQALEEQAKAKNEQNKANKILEEVEKAKKKALEDLERAQKKLLHEQEKAQKKAPEEQERAQKALGTSQEGCVGKQGNFKEKVLVQWERPQKNLAEEDVQCQRNTEETGSVCKICSGELEITQSKDLKEQATLSLQQGTHSKREAEEQSSGPKPVLEEGLSPGGRTDQP